MRWEVLFFVKFFILVILNICLSFGQLVWRDFDRQFFISVLCITFGVATVIFIVVFSFFREVQSKDNRGLFLFLILSGQGSGQSFFEVYGFGLYFLIQLDLVRVFIVRRVFFLVRMWVQFFGMTVFFYVFFWFWVRGFVFIYFLFLQKVMMFLKALISNFLESLNEKFSIEQLKGRICINYTCVQSGIYCLWLGFGEIDIVLVIVGQRLFLVLEKKNFISKQGDVFFCFIFFWVKKLI